MSEHLTLADVVHQSITFSPQVPSQELLIKLIEHPWVQRLRDVSQTANTRLVYMFSEHSRFGHSIGVAYLADRLLEHLGQRFPSEVQPYRCAVSAAALLHDIGHIAPGSHIAFKCWFPHLKDAHEQVAARIIAADQGLRELLNSACQDGAELVRRILLEDEALPPWCWELISGGGWNVDRGNWCVVDSVLAGVSYGHYNIPALTESITITPGGRLGFRENRLDAMMHFAISRHAMYRQIYQHRVLLAADRLNISVVQRARDLGTRISFADDIMRAALAAETPEQLSLETIFEMREAWWRYHLMRWRAGSDPVLADLADRLVNRRLLKTVRVGIGDDYRELMARAERLVQDCGYDPRYYLHRVSTVDVHGGDEAHSLPVLMDDGRELSLAEADPLYRALVRESGQTLREWIVLPAEAKMKLGRSR